MGKTIDVNQSQTVTNLPFSFTKGELTEVTITLERVELSAEGVKFHAFATSPQYELPQYSPRAAPGAPSFPPSSIPPQSLVSYPTFFFNVIIPYMSS